MKKPNYKAIYQKYHASEQAKKDRAARNKANRELDPPPGYEVDHKKPLSKGGSYAKSNLRVISRRANRRKGNRG